MRRNDIYDKIEGRADKMRWGEKLTKRNIF